MINENNTIVLPRQGPLSELAPIKITVREVRRIDTKQGNPLPNPCHSVDCSGLPRDNAGNEITSFAIFENSDFSPAAFQVGKTYEIAGIVSGRFFNLKGIIGEVANAVPGVQGVPKDPERERALNAAMMTSSEIMKSLSFEHESDAFTAFEFLYNQIVALRFSDNEGANER